MNSRRRVAWIGLTVLLVAGLLVGPAPRAGGGASDPTTTLRGFSTAAITDAPPASSGRSSS